MAKYEEMRTVVLFYHLHLVWASVSGVSETPSGL